MRKLVLFFCCILVGCGGGGGGGGTVPPPPDPIPLSSPPPGIYAGIIDWSDNDRSCSLQVLDDGTGKASGEVLLTINGGTGSISGTLANNRLSYINNHIVSILQYPDGKVQIVAVEFSNTLVNVSK